MKASAASSPERIDPRHLGPGGVVGGAPATDCAAVRKDVLHFYRAYSSRAPMVHIAGRRDAQQPSGHASVKIYTNAPRVMLEVNGATFGVARPGRICVWHGVPLAPGSNTLTVRTDSGVTDTVVWDCAP
jgi:beta-galactosidase